MNRSDMAQSKGYEGSFCAVFQINKLDMFEVNYGHVKGNLTPYFSTSACRFIRSKLDFSQGGQCQEDLFKNEKPIIEFYRKWNPKHLQTLTVEEYGEMHEDLAKLMELYNYIYDPECKITFSQTKELSMQKVKAKNQKNA